MAGLNQPNPGEKLMPSRRDAIAMTMDEIRAYLKEQERLILTSNGASGYPHPMPMNFVFDDDDHYLVTTFRKAQKVKNIERDPRCALLVESGHRYNELKSVLAHADANIIDDLATTRSVMLALAQKEFGRNNNMSEEARQQALSSAPKRVVISFKANDYISWDHTKLDGRYYGSSQNVPAASSRAISSPDIFSSSSST
jgi:nitroimidazol reductase NimA-like FMN-containing flavoprotein (pyridoxamine 5'-phosphate oxidase superfamily)